ncbi:hypothetical protein [Candidatus Poriferisodalis sp.]|uniref:hypothetical protein n=1 Tax=Candidatus Poriferisodalis sp. TaxID=3101277 RepID=UPI003D11AADC
MTAADRLRSHLQQTAASLPAGSGSLGAVRARAAQMQRRRNAVRGGAGVFALVAVAAIGVVSLQDRGAQDYGTEADADIASDDFAEEMQDPLGASGDFGETGDDTFAAADDMPESAIEFEMADEAEEPQVARATEAETAPQDTEAGASQTSDESPRADSGGSGVVFAAAVSAVAPPDEAEGTAMRYSFSGAHALAQSADDWYAFDGSQWQLVGLPEDIEVVAVDLSASERIAIVGVVRPLECAIEHVVGVKTAEGWSFTRIDDGTPPMVSSELLDARVYLTDAAVVVERTERLWLNDACADAGEYDAPTGAAPELVNDLLGLDELQRQSWLVAELEPDFAQHWPRVASDDAPAAALKRSGLQWTPTEAPLYTVEARELTAVRPSTGDAIGVALHETTMLEVTTSVEVSDGMALLRRGDQTWEVCPIPDVEEAHGEIGWAGENLAVVVGKPEQTLFVVERTE